MIVPTLFLAGAKGRGAVDDNVNVVPCDALLVRGSCVVNEAMLTGESVPQMKETLRARTTFVGGSNSSAEGQAGDRVELGNESHVEPQWKRHMVFSGTSLMLHTERVEADGTSAGVGGLPSAPDGGCVAVVIRTGFGTSQVCPRRLFPVPSPLLCNFSYTVARLLNDNNNFYCREG